jgi:soluble lytic murein transglycosylase-like protein
MNRSEKFFNYHLKMNLHIFKWLLIISLILWGLACYQEKEIRVQKLEQKLLKQRNKIIRLQQEVAEAETVKRIMESYGCRNELIYKEIMATWDPVVVAIVIGIESEYRQYARSSSDCCGLMQISREHGLADPFDVQTNIRFGAGYLQEQWNQFKTLEGAIWAYNAGPGRVGKFLPEETRQYIRRVRTLMEAYHDPEPVI